MLESKFRREVVKRLRGLGGHWRVTHGGGYQAPGLPDIIGCLHGRYVGIELKAPGRYANPEIGLSPRQEQEMNAINENDGVAICADSWELIEKILKEAGLV